MLSGKNRIATPLVEKAMKMHKYIFRYVYPFPLNIHVSQGLVLLKVSDIRKFKYIPLFISILFVTFTMGVGSCICQPIYKLFHRNFQMHIVGIVICIFFGSCAATECATYLVYFHSNDVIKVLNELFATKRKCKCIRFYNLQCNTILSIT